MESFRPSGDSLGRNARIEASIVWPGSVAGAVFARTVIDGEDTLVVRCWCPNIAGFFAEFHYRSTERIEAKDCFETVLYGISKLCLHERTVSLEPSQFAMRMAQWQHDLRRDKRLAKVSLIPADVDWRF